MNFSVCHASARPDGWQESYRSCLIGADQERELEYVLSYDSRFGDFQLKSGQPQFIKPYELDPSEPKNSVANWNNAARHSTGKVIILNADDFRFPPRWDTELLKAIPDLTADFAVHVSTGALDAAHEARLISLIIFSRARYEKQGYALYPEYESMDSDVDFTEHAYRDGVVIQARYLTFEHVHPLWGKAQYDDVYKWQNRPEAYAHGLVVLARRRAVGFSK